MFYLALHSSDDKNIDLNEIAAEQNIPKHFLSKILQLLVKEKLLVSMKGPTGGYRLNRPGEEIALLEIVEAIDGLDIFDQCGIGFRKCDPDHPCPIHDDYKRIRDRVYLLFENKTLGGLSREFTEDKSMAKIIKPSDTG